VAHCLYYGEGVSQNIQNAYRLLLEIAEKNSDGQLMKYIGDEYYYGSDTSISISNTKKNKDIKKQIEEDKKNTDIKEQTEEDQNIVNIYIISYNTIFKVY